MPPPVVLPQLRCLLFYTCLSTAQARRVGGEAQPPLLQRLSGRATGTRSCPTTKPAAENWWTQSTCLQRGFVVLCLALMFGLSGLVAFEVRCFIKDPHQTIPTIT